VADYDPIRERMATMSENELRVAVADIGILTWLVHILTH
jgi:hypothetical protein